MNACRICGNPGGQCCRSAPWVTLDEFKRAWTRANGKASNESDRRFMRHGIIEFYSDYLTSDSTSPAAYMRAISEPAR